MIDYKKVNEDIFNKDSELCRHLKFGIPWVETLILYLQNSDYKGSSSKLFIDIASNFVESNFEAKVIFNGQFQAKRLPTKEEVNTAVELMSSNNRITEKIQERMAIDGCDFINGLSMESHVEIFETIDFEVSSPVTLYYLLGYLYLDNRGKDAIYGLSKDNHFRKIIETQEGSLIEEITLSELYHNEMSDMLGLSHFF